METIEISETLETLDIQLEELEQPLNEFKDYYIQSSYLHMRDKWLELLQHVEDHQTNENNNKLIDPAILHTKEFNGLLKMLQVMKTQLVFFEDKFGLFQNREINKAYGDLISSFQVINEKLEENLY